MRAAVGTQLTLFDGSGAEFDAVVEPTASRRGDSCESSNDAKSNRELPFALVVGVALPKGDRQKWLVEKLTELGVTDTRAARHRARRGSTTAPPPSA